MSVGRLYNNYHTKNDTFVRERGGWPVDDGGRVLMRFRVNKIYNITESG